MTVLPLLPLLLIQQCNKFDLYLHSKLFTEKTQIKQEEQAYKSMEYSIANTGKK